MTQPSDDDAFDRLSWHDNLIYGLSLVVGDAERQEWYSKLVLDIDHIVEWICGADGGVKFLVAPADLTFHNTTDLGLAVDFGDSGCRTALNELSIHGITRERIKDQRICLDRPYYRWRIAFTWPKEATISFGASGFTQILRAQPLLQDEQRLSTAERC